MAAQPVERPAERPHHHQGMAYSWTTGVQGIQFTYQYWNEHRWWYSLSRNNRYSLYHWSPWVSSHNPMEYAWCKVCI